MSAARLALRRLALPSGALLLAAGVVASGLLPGDAARGVVERVLPVLGFLVAVTVLAELADAAGLFDAAAALAARVARGRVAALGALVVVLGVTCTILGSLDTTAVLLTPVVLRLAARLRLDPLPWAVTTLWLANTASLLLPVSNLTNLLAAQRLGWTATAWAGRVAPAAGAAVLATALVAWVVHRTHVRGRYAWPDGEAPVAPDPAGQSGAPGAGDEGLGAHDPSAHDTGTHDQGAHDQGTHDPSTRDQGTRDQGAHDPGDAVLLAGAGAACGGFVLAVLLGAPAWAAATGGALALGALTARRRSQALSFSLVPVAMPLVTAAMFVLVAAADRHGLAAQLARLIGDGGASGGGASGGVAAGGAGGIGVAEAVRTAGGSSLAASAANNLPAYLALEPVAHAAASGVGAGTAAGEDRLLAVLVGVNVGPLLTPWGSLATVLWAQRCRAAGVRVPWLRVLALSWLLVAVVVPVTAAVLALT